MARRRPHPRHPFASAAVPPSSFESQPKPLRSADQATRLIDLAVSRPLAHETICLFVDEGYLPLACIVVEGDQQPDDVLGVADLLAQVALDHAALHVILVCCRPGHGFEPGDVQRWFGLDHLLSEAGLDLVEWFVRDEHTMVAVSALAGEPSRWPSNSG